MDAEQQFGSRVSLRRSLFGKGIRAMHGVWITEGIEDWQIVQRENGAAKIRLAGEFRVPDAAVEVGCESAVPKVRVMSEDDNRQVIIWTECSYEYTEKPVKGTWSCVLTVPEGGLYRIETGLHTKSIRPDLGWIFRGDIRVHVGVGDLFIVAGQSNSAGYAKDSAFDPPSPMVHLFRNRRKWDLACHPINESTDAPDDPNAELGVSGVSPYLSFGKRFSDLSHVPVGLINTALGGSPIRRWDPEQKGDLYRNMIDKVKLCGGMAAGLLWYQGCSDTDTLEQANAYGENFGHVVSHTREDLGYEIPFFTFQVNRYVDGAIDEAWGLVREAQRRAARETDGVYVLSTTNCGLSDGIHNNAHANALLGERMAKLCGQVLLGTEEFMAPDLSKAVYEKDGSVTLLFDHMKAGFMLSGGAASPYGISIKDELGEAEIANVMQDKEKNNALKVTVKRPLQGKAVVSCAWEANPTFLPPLDEVTYLPVLSFYEAEISC